jgi:hypothetical protein
MPPTRQEIVTAREERERRTQEELDRCIGLFLENEVNTVLTAMLSGRYVSHGSVWRNVQGRMGGTISSHRSGVDVEFDEHDLPAPVFRMILDAAIEYYRTHGYEVTPSYSYHDGCDYSTIHIHC